MYRKRNIGVDSRGFICKEGSLGRVRSPYTAVVRYLVQAMAEARAGDPSDQIHSLYLYGSVPKGTARPGVSDLDLTAVAHAGRFDHRSAAFLDRLAQSLTSRFPFLTKVDIPTCSVDDVLSDANRYSWGFWVKVICTRVSGSDLGAQLPRYRPNWDLALGLNADIGDYVQSVRRRLGQARSTEGDRQADDAIEVADLCRSIGRKLTRAAFCLVMPVEECWTSDLKVAARMVTTHYPSWQADVATTLRWASRPDGDVPEMTRVVEELGEAIVAGCEGRGGAAIPPSSSRSGR